MNPLKRVLAALADKGCAASGSSPQWNSRCPAHDDDKPSLRISIGSDGKVLLHCHAGCSTETVVASLGLGMRDLAAQSDTGGDTTPDEQTLNAGSVTTHPAGSAEDSFAESKEALAAYGLGEPTSTYAYFQADGTPAFVIGRWDGATGKQIRPVTQKDGAWKQAGGQDPRPLYRLPELLESDPDEPVLVLEGETCAEAAIELGFVATTSSHGSKAATKTDWSPLRGRRVVVIPDHDRAGREYSRDVADLLLEVGVTSVMTLDVTALTDASLPEGGDLVDVVAADDDDCAASVRERILDTIERGEFIGPEERHDPLAWVPFPSELLPEPLGRFVRESAKALCCDESYIALPLLSTCAAAIGNTHVCRVKSTWKEPSILWTVIIGESGTTKSPALHHATEPLRRCQQRIASEQTGTGCPADRVLTTSDATPEALADLLSRNPEGVLLFRDELAGWFGSFDAYTARGAVSKDAPLWLEVYGGRPLRIDRKTGDNRVIEVSRASVSITGGIQPEVIAKALEGSLTENGLAPRFLMSSPPRRPARWSDDDLDEAIIEEIADILHDLLSCAAPFRQKQCNPTEVPLSDDAKRRFQAFYDAEGQLNVTRDREAAAIWAKIPGVAVRLALVMHLAKRSNGTAGTATIPPISAETMDGAIGLAKWFGNESERIVRLRSLDPERRRLLELTLTIEDAGGSMSPRDLNRSHAAYRDRGGAERAEVDLQKLVDHGYGQWEHPAPGMRGGRPTKRFSLIRGRPARTSARSAN